MIHSEPHPLAGRTVTVELKGPHHQLEGTTHEFEIEDWWDRISHKNLSWAESHGNWAAELFGIRVGQFKNATELLNKDQMNEVVYGKIGGYGNIVHQSEIILPEAKSSTQPPILNFYELAHTLSEKLDDFSPINLHRRWVPLAEALWERLPIMRRKSLLELAQRVNKEAADWHTGGYQPGLTDPILEEIVDKFIKEQK
jgi:hypothetical protein